MSRCEVPVLETERLRLRELRPDDFPFWREMWANADVTRYIGGRPKTEEESWTGFLRMAGHWAIMGYGYWLVEKQDDGERLGEVGFVDFKREIKPSIKGEPEIGWIFTPSAQGKGYATEAALAAVRWGDEYFEGARMSCLIEVENAPSIRVAEKCGFSRTGLVEYEGDQVVLLHRG